MRKISQAEALKIVAAAEAFIQTIEATGGVSHIPPLGYSPVGDEEWYDLGDSYVTMCTALGRTPVVHPIGIEYEDLT